MVGVHVAVIVVLIGDTFLNSTVETVKQHFILYSNYIKLETYYNVFLLQVKVLQVPNVELDAPGCLNVLMNASNIKACIDLCNC